MYPDATGKLRLSFGQAKGPVKDNGIGPFVTTIGGAFVRNTGRDPFALPVSWVEAKDKLNLDLPLNVATTNEVVGGNSGSSLLNKNAELIGLVFDSNLSGRGNAYVGQNTERWLSIARASWRYCPRCIERTELCSKSGQRTVGNGDSHHLACQSLGLREEVFVARASMSARGSSRAGRTATLTVRHRRKRYFSRCPVLNSAYLDRRGRVRLPQLPCLVFLGKPMGTDAMRLVEEVFVDVAEGFASGARFL
jgi:hypothetical protein